MQATLMLQQAIGQVLEKATPKPQFGYQYYNKGFVCADFLYHYLFLSAFENPFYPRPIYLVKKIRIFI